MSKSRIHGKSCEIHKIFYSRILDAQNILINDNECPVLQLILSFNGNWCCGILLWYLFPFEKMDWI